MTPEAHGFVLAAGLGTRLRPVTDYLPKPLLPLEGVTLLDRAAAALLAAGCRTVVVNAHHRAHRVAEHLAQRHDHQRFHLSLEPTLLGTAGAFGGAREVLATAEHFVVFNGDVACDADLGRLLADHAASDALATLLLVDHPAVNTVCLGRDGLVRDLAGVLGTAPSAGDALLTFTGVACYRRAVLDDVPVGPSDLVNLLTSLIARRPDAVRGARHAGAWQDLGTLERYLDAHRGRLGPGFVSLGRGASVAPGAVLDECVVLPGVTVPPGVVARRAVIGAGWQVSADAAADPALALATAAGFSGAVSVAEFADHGSDRRLVRLQDGDRRAVLMSAHPGDPDHDRTVAIASFLYDTGLGAPAVLARDDRAGSILFEDLGDDTLERLLAQDPAAAPRLYDRVLDRLADLQTFGAEARHGCPVAWSRLFDEDHLRWETDYFRDRYLVGHLGLEPVAVATLDDDFAALAAACLDHPRTLVHRDFQSQNILLKDGVVRLVDVQGMRWGSAAYDAVSLCYDPYVDLPDSLREELLDSFPARVSARGGRAIEPVAWRRMTATAGLQRLMQALGAYSFLGHVKGRRRFLRHIPAARRQLERILRVAQQLPVTGDCRVPPLAELARILS